MDSSPKIGRSSPIGATLIDGGVNFSLFSRHASEVELLLFDREDDPQPSRIIPLDPIANRTYHYWHVFVPGLKSGQIYAYRVYGPFDPQHGQRFDPRKILLDPYCRSVVVPKSYSRDDAGKPGDNTPTAMKSVVVNVDDYDWEGDLPLRRPSSRTIIYEMHVRGFTRHSSSGLPPEQRGTFAGLIKKIPYLKEIGITAVELLPVFHFDLQDSPLGHVNYWGYAPISFFAPHPEYSADRSPLGPINEFRDMVKALHRAGIEVILDVVFNHTAEGSEFGPTLSFRGIDNETYYMLDRNKAHYLDFSGTGNTFKANHPVVRRLIIDSLCYWVQEMHVDGFRFDLASILSRDAEGHVLRNPPVLWDIESEPALAGTKLIAEAWDAGGLYQVGQFVGDAWKEWNGRFRDDARSFFRGDSGALADFADRMVGSPQIYGHKNREPTQSVNFVTCHDGFTLNDLVSYDHKHNAPNGEGNRDGCDDNRSWNCGVEGPTDDPAIEKLRNRQVKNFITVTLLSVGVPMFVMGDEVRRTQQGNNNAYCQDNELNWFDWSLVHTHADVLRFTRLLIERRLLRDADHEHRRVSLSELISLAPHSWHGIKLNEPDWSRDSHCIAFCSEVRKEGLRFHLMLNAWDQPMNFELPQSDRNGQPLLWRRWIDTALESPDDIVPWTEAIAVSPPEFYTVSPHSVVMLYSQISPTPTLPR